MTDPGDLFALLAEAVAAMKPDRVANLARQVLERKLSPDKAITEGLAAGMRLVGEKYASKVYFVPEVLLASKAMYAGFDILRQALGDEPKRKGRVALGVVRGDIHDIGKNIVKVMVEAAGFEVVDLGRNVPVAEFVRAADQGVELVGISSLMTTTMPRMADVVKALDRRGLRPQTRVVIGGAPVNAMFAERIGADTWAPNAHSAVQAIEELLSAS